MKSIVTYIQKETQDSIFIRRRELVVFTSWLTKSCKGQAMMWKKAEGAFVVARGTFRPKLW
jgi:hypothetical protein